MSLLVIDIGGSSVKYGYYGQDGLADTGSFITPDSYAVMKSELSDIFMRMKKHKDLEGVAISAPGAVESTLGIIGGLSAVPYIHNFDIKKDLEDLFGVPVSLENDANCAALAELYEGAAKESENILFMVIGSGIGGALILNRKLHKGRNLFGGEFGYMMIQGEDTLSKLGSPVQMAERYSIEREELTEGSEVFRRADAGEELAKKHVENLLDSLSRGIFNLSVAFNPDLVIIGGGLSKREDLIPRLQEKVELYIKERGAEGLEVNLVPCAFRSDANLIGAAIHFRESRK